MKRKLVLVLIGIMTLTACSGNTRTESGSNAAESGESSAEKVESTTESEAGTSEESSEAETLKIGDTATTENWEITVNSAEVVEKIDGDFGTYFKPDEGNKYLVVNLSVKNISKDAETFLPYVGFGDDISAKVKYQDYEFSSTNLLGHSEEMHDSHINPLSSKTGIIAFSLANEVTENLGDVHVVFNERRTDYDFSLGE